MSDNKSTRSKYPRATKSIVVTMETSSKESAKEGKEDVSNAFGRAIKEMNETNLAIRKAEKEENEMKLMLMAKSHEENMKQLTDKLTALHTTQIASFEAQRQSIKTPLPKYGGNPGKLENW